MSAEPDREDTLSRDVEPVEKGKALRGVKVSVRPWDEIALVRCCAGRRAVTHSRTG